MAYRLVTEPGEDPSRRRSRRQPQQGELRRKLARRGIATLPTAFTLGNLLCGCAAIFLASREQGLNLPFGWTPLTFAAVFVFLGMVFDGLDGRIARLTRSASELGEQLDSMADMVTFGVAPAFMAVQLADVAAPFLSETDRLFDRVVLVVAGIYAACAALRLARFNIEVTDSDNHSSFKGLPSPGAAGTVASLVLLHQHFLARQLENDWRVEAAAVGVVVVLGLVAVAMVSSFRYVHVMNRYVRNRAPFSTISKAVIVGLLLAIHLQGALAAAFTLYALSAPVAWAWRWVRGKAGQPEPAAVGPSAHAPAEHVSDEAV